MSKQKRVMVIGGGAYQTYIIKRAKELGYFVINTDINENAISFKYADKHGVISSLDCEELLDFARRYSPDAVITDQSDMAVRSVAYLCQHLGLPGIGIDKAELFTNKFLMREFCRNNNFLYPRYKLCSSLNEAEEFARLIGFPIVLKPVDNQSSKGVNKVSSQEELTTKYNDALSNNRLVYGIVLAEEFIGGTELTVEGIKTQQKHYSLAVSQKSHIKEREMVAYKLLYSSHNEIINYEILKEINNSIVEKMALPFGLTHAEYKYFNGRFYLVEIAARGGGTRISSDIVPRISGINTNELFINMALGNRINDLKFEHKKVCVVLEFFLLKSGRVKKIRGLEIAKQIPNVVDIVLNFGEGDYLSAPSDDNTRPGYFIAYESNEKALEELGERIKRTIEVEYA